MYTILDTKQVTELTMRRRGWFSPHYELTDGAYSYGSLSYKLGSGLKATVISAIDTWIFKRDDLFGRTVLITNQNSEYIGKITSDRFIRKRFLTLQNGFQAEFSRSSFLYSEFIWQSEGYGKIMHIKSFPLNLKNTIYIDPGTAPASLIPLLIFLGTHLTVLRRRRRLIIVKNLLIFFGGSGSVNPVINTGTLKG